MALRAGIGLSWVTVLVLMVACAATNTPTPRPSAIPTVVAPVASAPAKALEPGPTTWTDSRVVSALAESCTFTPGPPPEGPTMWAPENPFACRFAMQQACVRTDCGDAEETCKDGCQSTCASCDARCTTACGSCEATCSDLTCRQACAATTAECKQACVGAMERCESGGCEKQLDACFGVEKALYDKNHCDERCEARHKCVFACPVRGDENNGRLTACEERCNARAMPCTMRMCLGE